MDPLSDSRCEHLILLMISGLVATGVAWFALDPFFHWWQQEVWRERVLQGVVLLSITLFFGALIVGHFGDCEAAWRAWDE